MGLLDGLGLLMLLRRSDGEVVEAAGTWRPKSGTLGYEDLCELFRPGAALTYQGPAYQRTVDDGGSRVASAKMGGADDFCKEVRMEVEIEAVERREPAADGLSGDDSVILLALHVDSGDGKDHR